MSVDHVNNLGWTALHESVILGDGSVRYVDTVRVLVATGADVRLRSQRDQVTPLAHARSNGFDAIAEVLQAAIDADDPSKRQANRRLLAAAAAGDATRAALAVRGGADVETRDDRGRTPLLLAVTEDELAIARLLVHLGADPNARDDRHDTPWLVTGVTGSVAMADVLLPAHPDLNIRNRFGGVSLIPASERGHLDYVRRVVKTGIDVALGSEGPGRRCQPRLSMTSAGPPCSKRSSSATEPSGTKTWWQPCSPTEPTGNCPIATGSPPFNTPSAADTQQSLTCCEADACDGRHDPDG